MSILNNLRRAFGFSESISESDMEDDFAPYSDSPQRAPYINPFKKENPIMSETKTDKTSSAEHAQPTVQQMSSDTSTKFELPNDFLNSIIEIVNANLPQIVKECVDIEAEKKALSQTFDTHFQTAMSNVHSAALEEAKRQWTSERATLNEKISALTSSIEENVKRTAEIRQRLQVEESKRHSANERADKFEKQVKTLEAEHEQYMIENKSLQNKMKVMQVYADDAQAFKEQVTDRDNLINDLNVKIADSDKLVESARAEINDLKAELAEANSNLEIVHELEKQLEQVDSFKTKKNNEIKSLKEQIEELRGNCEKLQLEKDNFVLQMKSASDSNAELSSSISELKAEHETAIRRLESEYAEAIGKITGERDAAISQLEDEKASHKSDNSYYEQKLKFIEAEQKRKETELNDEIKRLSEKKPSIALSGDIDEDIKDAVSETFGISTNSLSQASEPAVPNEMFDSDSFSDDNIDATFEPHETSAEAEPVAENANIEVKEQKPTVSVSAIDELDDIDWLMPTPPTPPVEPEPTFIQEEVKTEKAQTQKAEPDNTQQMSLF